MSSLLPEQVHPPGVSARATRRFVEAIRWPMRCGVPWRGLPERFGAWHRVFVRFFRWHFKAYRDIATRFEKTTTAYLALATLAAIQIWLRLKNVP